MSRCDYDAVFHRVFSITLLAIAFTFTIILTNVFIDIDGLLASKDKGVSKRSHIKAIVSPEHTKENFASERRKKPVSRRRNIGTVEDIEESSARTKRSLEKDSFKYHLSNAKVKKILTDRLEKLLEEIDLKERSSTTRVPTSSKLSPKVKLRTKYRRQENKHVDDGQDSTIDDDMLHLAMHNILLQGILGHMDLTHIYNKVHELVSNFEKVGGVTKTRSVKGKKTTELLDPRRLYGVEKKFFNEILQCTKLRDQVDGANDKNDQDGSDKELTKEELRNDENSKHGINNNENIIDEPIIKDERIKDENKKDEHATDEPVEKDQIKDDHVRVDHNIDEYMTNDHNKDELKNTKLADSTTNTADYNGIRQSKTTKRPKMFIKTLIDITSLNSDGTDETDPAKDIKGVLKLIFNGKTINFNNMYGEEEATTKRTTNLTSINHFGDAATVKHSTENDKDSDKEIIEKSINEKHDDVNENIEKVSINYPSIPNIELDVLESSTAPFNNRRSSIDKNSGKNDYFKVSDYYLKKAIQEYLARQSTQEKENSDSYNKRPKRNANIKLRQYPSKRKEEIKDNKDKSDDEVYVEIETHYNGKGVTNGKKKKLVKSLIEKIQRAIRSDQLEKQEQKKRMQLRKTIASPIEDTDRVLRNKITISLDNIDRRKSNPISKAETQTEAVSTADDLNEEPWKNGFFGPRYFTTPKTINSEEPGDVYIDFSKTDSDGIAHRIQKPLNEHDGKNKPMHDLGNVKFFIKDLDGSGFSIGFNQFVAEAPDSESIKLFSGLEHILNTYRAHSDESELTTEINDKDETETEQSRGKGVYERSKRNYRNKRNTKNRKKDGNDYHSNEYKIIFSGDFLPYDNYQEIFEDKNKRVSLTLQKESNNSFEHGQGLITGDKSLPFIIAENIFDKDLKPSEIFGLAELMDRKKRSLTTLKNKIIRTKRWLTKEMILKNRRKRHVDKIRIISSDKNPNIQRQSDENIFVVSDETLSGAAEAKEDAVDPQEELMDYEKVDNENVPFVENAHLDFQPPSNIFEARSRHNILMSKYPHVFMEQISRSKENEFQPSTFNGVLLNQQRGIAPTEPEESTEKYNQPFALTKRTINDPQQILQPPHSNYKLTVKILPKNLTMSDVDSGFKEIRTSINKSVSKGGMIFSSLVNVSEITKVLKDNGTNNATDYAVVSSDTYTPVGSTQSPLVKRIKEQQQKMKLLLREHRTRIDQQLNNLQKEKQNIETAMEKEDNSNETLEVMLPMNPPKTFKINKKDAKELIASSIMRLRSIPENYSTEKTTAAPSKATETTTEFPTSTSTTFPKPVFDPDKMKLLGSIQRNENLTNEILNKINKNTEMLHTFLEKITDRIIRNEERRMVDSLKREDLQEEPKSLSFNQQMPVPIIMKNGSNVAIPFVYAYQQPYSHGPKEKINDQVANIVYQGHIHTNALQSKLGGKEVKPEIKQDRANELHSTNLMPSKREVNSTKFFFDEYPGFPIGRDDKKKVQKHASRLRKS